MLDGFHKIHLGLLRIGNRGISRMEFMQETARLIPQIFDCDAVEFWITESGRLFRWIIGLKPHPSFRMRLHQRESFLKLKDRRLTQDNLGRVALGKQEIIEIRDSHGTIDFIDELDAGVPGGNFHTLFYSPFLFSENNLGLMILKTHQRNRKIDHKAVYEFCDTFGLAVSDRRAQYALRERVKELSCLYGISQLTQTTHLNLEEIFRSTVKLLPPAWQYPDFAAARIIFDKQSFTTKGYKENENTLKAPIVVSGELRGKVEVVYTRLTPDMEDECFLKEEEHLINAVANQLSLLIEKKTTQTEQANLQRQLRHADRLATIGQLSAGVAHELNEPLNAILGFSQLIKNEEILSENADSDLERIIKSAIHARDIVKKLLLFGRELPEKQILTDINEIVENGLYFSESRCQKEQITLRKILDRDIPRVRIDPGQMHQVLTNLVINGIQAIDNGGNIEIRTYFQKGYVYLEVTDDGCGMTDEIKDKIFLPFFTTKDIGKGTGLGLSVVYGIISSAGGDIRVISKPGIGTTFRIKLPEGQDEK